MPHIYVTQPTPEPAEAMLKAKGYTITANPKKRILSKKELIKALRRNSYDGVLSFLTDTIDAEVMAAMPSVKIISNYAIGYNNVNIEEAKRKNVRVTNTPSDKLNDTIAEHTFALISALASRIIERDSFTKKGKYTGWDPLLLLGTDLKGKTLAVIGTGRIGSRVAHMARHGYGMNIVYYDVVRNEKLESECEAKFASTVEEALTVADVATLHVPLLESTRHLINTQRLALMKKTAYLINTSRGPVVDERALIDALRKGAIAGAGLDVFEFEPDISRSLRKLPNVVLTPHVASGTLEARHEMSRLAAENIIEFFEGRTPPHMVV